MAKTWKRIIIHCSASSWGSAAEIRKWHLERDWTDCGYHFVIGNGKIRTDLYLDSQDGSVEIGRRIDGDQIVEDGEQGAHAYGFNSDSIGICLIGTDEFTGRQIGSLLDLIRDLKLRFELKNVDIIGHYEINPAKSCPNLDMKAFRQILEKVV